jgi:alpha-galactosidase
MRPRSVLGASRHLSALVFVAALSLIPACGGDGDAAKPPATPTNYGPPELDDDLPLPRAEGRAPTPPMGWNSWNSFGIEVTADDIKAAADILVSSGMKDAGYEYVNIDDGWGAPLENPDAKPPIPSERNDDGTPRTDDDFPDIAELADYVHGLGLKLGIYSDRGTQTCGHRVGSQDHSEIDAQQYADWGVDYLKYDNCSADENETVKRTQYGDMRTALDATGRDIVYSLCAWEFNEWGLGMGQLWRTTSDIIPTFAGDPSDPKGLDAEHTVLGIARINNNFAAYAGPNGWNDADMLEVGRFGDDAESRAHFSLWAIMASPLIAGNDLSIMSDATREILTNSEVIAVDQDALGMQGVLLKTVGDLAVWSKPLNESGARAVAIVNKGSDSSASVTVTWPEIGLRGGDAEVRDLWQHADLGTTRDAITTTVPSHDVVMLRVTGSEPTHPTKTVQLGDFPWIYAANGLGPVERNRSNGASAAGDGQPLSIGGQAFTHGLGVSAPASVIYRLAKNCSRFTATAGMDDAAGDGSVEFHVLGDGKVLWESGIVKKADGAQSIDVSVEGVVRLKLLVTNAGDGPALDRASFGDPLVECGPR